MSTRPTGPSRPWLARRVLQPIAALLFCAAVGGLAQAVDERPGSSRSVASVTVSHAADSVLLDPASTVMAERRARRAQQQLRVLARRSHFAVSAVDLSSGRRVTLGRDRFRTASLVKVHLATLQDLEPGRPRSSAAMIRVSDNAAADDAYDQLGGGARIQRRLRERLHLHGITVARDGSWGLSRTTATSVTDLLRVVFDRDQRRLARLRGLMSTVTEAQRGGVSAAADPGTRTALKNGWLPRSDGWIVTSAGRVIVDGHPWVVAVLTDRMPTLRRGLTRVGQIARLAVAAAEPPTTRPVADSRPTFQPVRG